MNPRSTVLFGLLVSLCAVLSAAETRDLIPGFKYISDPKARVSDVELMSAEQKDAIKRGKKVLAEYLKTEVRGDFSVAEGDWGFQIAFNAIECLHGDAWKREIEGFGEIFLSRDLKTFVINYGP